MSNSEDELDPADCNMQYVEDYFDLTNAADYLKYTMDLEEGAENYLSYDVDDEEVAQVDDSIAHLVGHSKDVFCLTLSNSKRWLASGAEDDSACVWDLDNPDVSKPYMRITEHEDSVNSITFNPSSTLLATADMAGRIVCTNVECKQIEDCSDLEWILWHSNADILFAGTNEGMIWMWLLSKNGVLQSKIYSRGAGSACLKGRLLPGSKQLLAVYSDGDVRIWDLKSATSSSVQLKSAGYAIDIHPTQPLAAVGCADGTTTLLNTTSLKVIKTFGQKTEKPKVENEEELGEDVALNENAIEVVGFAPAGFSWLVVGTTTGTLTIYDIESGAMRHACEHDGHAVVSALWRCNTKSDTLQIISICMDGGVRIWDAKSGEPIKANSCGGEGVFDFCIVERNDVARLFVGCSGGTIRVFEC